VVGMKSATHHWSGLAGVSQARWMWSG
jgi:hypothetical protein